MSAGEDFEGVVADLCRVSGVDDVQAVLDGAPLDYMGRLIWLEWIDHLAVCRITLVLEPPPPEHEPDFLRYMLQSNSATDDEWLPVFAIDPDSGQAVVAVHIMLESLLSELTLEEAFAELVEHVTDWEQQMRADLDALTPRLERASETPGLANHLSSVNLA